MVHTLFFSRLRELAGAERAEYQRWAGAALAQASAAHAGFVSHKTYVAEDGERLTVVSFRDEESQRAWRSDVLHREAQARGRREWYERYRIVVCSELRSHRWERRGGEVGG